MRKLMLALVPVIALAAAWPGEGEASFIGPYDVANWTTTLTGNPPGGGGSVDTSGAPNTVALFGGDSGCTQVVPCTLSFTIHAAETGLVTFHWAYQTTDIDGPSFDRFGHTLDGTVTQLSSDVGPDAQSGTDSFSVVPGSLFGFRIDCTDCILGPATVTIFDFSVSPLAEPSPVPEPSTLLLFGTTAAGLGVARWRQWKSSRNRAD